MNDFESLKQVSYNLIAEFIEKNPAEVATPAVIDAVSYTHLTLPTIYSV